MLSPFIGPNNHLAARFEGLIILRVRMCQLCAVASNATDPAHSAKGANCSVIRAASVMRAPYGYVWQVVAGKASRLIQLDRRV
jgi:hypothetical protein